MRQPGSIVLGSRERRAPLEGLVRSHDEAFLDPPGCPVCEYCVEAEEQFFRWFEIESFADPGLRCARHGWANVVYYEPPDAAARHGCKDNSDQASQ